MLGKPERVTSLPLDLWDLAIRQAREAGVLARLCFQLEDLGILAQLPEKPREHLEAARTLALKHARDVRWEVTCLRSVLAESGVPITLLKGAAYLLADLPPARGRLFADIDIMVPRTRLEEVERLLLHADWVPMVKDLYDQRYYRRWTHQIPPLQHVLRHSVLDVHHTIVPPTAHAPVSAAVLASESLPLDDDGQLHVLAPEDMVLHSAVHLFNEGEFNRGLRDLLDLHDLLSHFGRRPAFWDRLTGRAEALGLTGPLFLCCRYLDRVLGAPLPDRAGEATLQWQPSTLKRTTFDALFDRALLPDHESCNDRLTGAARWLLYVRAHYLRMPLHLLLPHLARKSLLRPADVREEEDRRRRQTRIEQLLRTMSPPKNETDRRQAMQRSDQIGIGSES
ncbi:nucleotidyltransferase domain-containing protein [Pelagibius marinus]|uniref:nucleotidyltransferase domain-containing protein n=1 Tax=Pelagibius marinus TaxID=2762760 RepID=UPI001872AEB6|nr:nucleotidyltransferase family protein [Pelagibius marinus]